MRHFIPFIASIFLLIAAEAIGQNLKVITYNIRMETTADGNNQWNNRREWLSNQVMQTEADIIGMQEVLQKQLIYLDSMMPGYGREGVGRDDGFQQGEYCPIYYNLKRFEKTDGGIFWLSPTPETPSIGWDAALNRICTWVKLKDKSTGQLITAFNTHFDHIGVDARRNSAQLIIETIKKLDSGETMVILTGDFNSEPASEPIALLSEHLTDTRTYTGIDSERIIPTFNGWDASKHNECIDFIFTGRNLKTKSYQVANSQTDGRYLSDHNMVMAEIER